MNRKRLLQETRKMQFEDLLDLWTESRLPQEEAARMLGACARTFRRYIDRYHESGLDGLLDKRLTQASARVDAHGMPVRVIVTQGATADCPQAVALIEEFVTQHLLADRGYDSNDIIAQAERQGMEPVIPPIRNRKKLREYDQYLYKIRQLGENAFLHLKRWRGIATRYAKNTASFLAAIHIRCISLWAAIS